MSQDNFYQLLSSLFQRDLPSAEREQLLKTLDDYPNGREIHARLQDALGGVSPLRDAAIPDTAVAWEQLASTLKLDLGPASKEQSPAGRAPYHWLAAAAVALLILSGIFLLPYFDSGSRAGTANRGEQLVLELPDGSSVVLNSESRLVYPKEFLGPQRQVHLAGEAYFEVQADRDHPFVVQTATATTVVLGTRFSVHDRQGALRVVVDHGSVSVEQKDGTSQIANLLAGQFLDRKEGEKEVRIQTVASQSLTAWRTGSLSFYQTPLDEIAAELSRRYNAYIKIGSLSASAQDYSLTGNFDNQELDQILSSICLALNLNYRFKEDGTVLIYKP